MVMWNWERGSVVLCLQERSVWLACEGSGKPGGAEPRPSEEGRLAAPGEEQEVAGRNYRVTAYVLPALVFPGLRPLTP